MSGTRKHRENRLRGVSKTSKGVQELTLPTSALTKLTGTGRVRQEAAFRAVENAIGQSGSLVRGLYGLTKYLSGGFIEFLGIMVSSIDGRRESRCKEKSRDENEVCEHAEPVLSEVAMGAGEGVGERDARVVRWSVVAPHKPVAIPDRPSAQIPNRP